MGVKNVYALKVNPKDTVAVVLSGPAAQGEPVEIRDHDGNSTELTALSDIPYGHKIAVCAVAAGCPIVKYGEVIGVASANIAPGEYVHVHNLESLRGRGDLES